MKTQGWMLALDLNNEHKRHVYHGLGWVGLSTLACGFVLCFVYLFCVYD